MSEYILELKDITMQFGGLKAVANLDFNVEERAIVGMIGPNGAGKTTVFNVITQHYTQTEGDVIFHGNTVVKQKPDKVVKKGIARTFQNIRLFTTLNVEENILAAMHMRLNSNLLSAIAGTRSYRSKMKAMTKEVGELLDIVDLNQYRNSISGSLPYGIQRRVEIARALATKPSLLLLDEPAAGMNPHEIEELMEFVRNIRNKFDLTVFVIEHHMSFVMNICEHICVLNYGRKIAEGNPKNIQNDPKVIEAYLGVDESVRN